MGQRLKAVGIKDVAAAAGVSTATVSLVFNQKGQVAPATRRHVEEVGRRLGYQPSLLGRALQSGRSHIIGVVVSYVESPVWHRTYMPYFRDIIAGAAIEVVEHGYAISAVPSTEAGFLELGIPLSGVIIVDPTVDDPLLDYCRRKGIAVVCDGPVPDADPSQRPPAVQINVRQSMADVLDHLLAAHAWMPANQAGDRPFRPALLTGPRMDSYTLGTLRSFEEWCLSRNIEYAVRTVEPGQDPLEAARKALAEWGGRLTAVHCLNETYCAAFLAAAEEIGLSIPSEIQLSVRGNGSAPMSDKRVAYLSVDTAEAGAVCARSLIALMNGDPVGDQEIEYKIIPAGYWEHGN